MPHESRVVVVTGGGQGIGRVTAMRLLREGWAVVLAEFDPEAGKEAAAEFGTLGPVRFLPTDVSGEV